MLDPYETNMKNALSESRVGGGGFGALKLFNFQEFSELEVLHFGMVSKELQIVLPSFTSTVSPMIWEAMGSPLAESAADLSQEQLLE